MNEIKVKLEKVDVKEKEILFRLLQYSLFEESETDLNEMNSDALFDYDWFDNYFTDDDRCAFFIKEQQTDKLLGFVMINSFVQFCNSGHSIAEFMVIPKYRRNKIGKQVAIQIFDMFKGDWEVKPSYKSEKAYYFWKKVIEEYTKNNYEFKDELFIFSN